MESRQSGTNTIDPSVQTAMLITIGAQPWWRGPVFAAVNTSKSPSVDPAMGGGGTEVDQSQLRDGVDGTGDANKETQNMGTVTDGSQGVENQNLQPDSSAMTSMMPEYLTPHTQLELGQSIACSTYPLTNPYFAGLVAPYGTQALRDY